MALTVSSSLNQKTWDATVRVTGGHPNQLWGIGAVQQSAEGEKLTVDRILVRDADERMVGYGQLQIRRDNGRVVVEGNQVHVNRAAMVPGFMETVAGYVEDRYGAERITLEVDAQGAQPLNDALEERGWKRQDQVEESEVGPKRLRVPLGVTEKALSSRLSAQTLDRCRAGLKVSDVTVREITANSGGVRAVGLKTGQINHLLKDLGQDSLLLVAAQERPDEQPEALGYLWFVHTVGLAMLYRVGFTRKARELGIDDALLLTGAVELQKRGVQRMDGGNSRDKDVPTVVREMADHERSVLGTWRKDLVEAPEAAPAPADAPTKKRGLFGRRKKQPEPAPVVEQVEQPEPRRVDEVRQQVSQDLGIEMTGMTPPQSEAPDPVPAQVSESGGARAEEGSAPAAATGAAVGATAAADAASTSTADKNGEAVSQRPETASEETSEGEPKMSKAARRKQRRQEKRAAKADPEPQSEASAPAAAVSTGDDDTATAYAVQDTPDAGDRATDAEPTSERSEGQETTQGVDSEEPGEPATDEETGSTPDEPVVAGELRDDEPHENTPRDGEAEKAPTEDEAQQDDAPLEDEPAEPVEDPARVEARARADQERQDRPEHKDGDAVARTADSLSGPEPKKSRGPLAFGKRLYSESLEAFKDAAGR
ncbi:hypothetical protein GWK18_06975 [Kocuria sp. JC486]|uniref:hypothetical protein n=1 Tax=Kocuria sp. JC486 TaxID=1970736 RepID=UPI001422EC33|nr:hypothetical protein [Kocuria sp. JC486]NHU85335.1 hypothetical protein [Kocuria sp. JC486]